MIPTRNRAGGGACPGPDPGALSFFIVNRWTTIFNGILADDIPPDAGQKQIMKFIPQSLA